MDCSFLVFNKVHGKQASETALATSSATPMPVSAILAMPCVGRSHEFHIIAWNDEKGG